jgi:hypothetical protein
VCRCSTVQRSLRLNLFHVCGYSGTVAVVTVVHWLYDVSSCLAVDGKRLQGSFSRTDVRTLIKFLLLLGKIALKCCKVLKKGIGTRDPSYEIVRLWVNAIKNGREETDNASRSRIPNIGDRWTSYGTSEICPWSQLQYFMNCSCYGSLNLTSTCLLYPHQQLWET